MNTLLKTKNYRCDEPMKRSKEDTNKWSCKGVCEKCICGLVQVSNGTWEHISIKED